VDRLAPPPPTRRARPRAGQAVLRHFAHEKFRGRGEAFDALLVDLEKAARAAVLDQHEARLPEDDRFLVDRDETSSHWEVAAHVEREA
jgi:hypothetical protein